MTMTAYASSSGELRPTQLAEEAERMGRIVAVTGAHAIILLDAVDGFFDENHRGAEIGTLMKVEGATTITLALISALSSPMPTHSSTEKELRIVEVEFIGELPKGKDGLPLSFRRGVSNIHHWVMWCSAPAAPNWPWLMLVKQKPQCAWATFNKTLQFQP